MRRPGRGGLAAATDRLNAGGHVGDVPNVFRDDGGGGDGDGALRHITTPHPSTPSPETLQRRGCAPPLEGLDYFSGHFQTGAFW